MTDQNSTPTPNASSTGDTGSGLSTADIATAMQPQPPGSQQDSTDTNSAQPATSATSSAGASAPLFKSDETDAFRSRWQDIQSTFVDDPRHAVEQGDNLVADIMKRLAELFASERSNLERQWEQGEDVSTEDLRLALQSYRSFFDRLLSV